MIKSSGGAVKVIEIRKGKIGERGMSTLPCDENLNNRLGKAKR
jgi:hypothetical protein